MAIKVLPAVVGRDSQPRAPLVREATAVAALAHPHICTLYDIGRDDEIEYLVMECLEGDTLATQLMHGPLSLEDQEYFAAGITEQLTADLAAIRALRVISRTSVLQAGSR